MAELVTIYYTEAENSNQLIKLTNTLNYIINYKNHTNHLLYSHSGKHC